MKGRRGRQPIEVDEGGNRLVKPGAFVWVRRVTIRCSDDRKVRTELGGYWARVLEQARVKRPGSWWTVRELTSWGTYTVNAAWCRVPRTPSSTVLAYQHQLELMRTKGVRALTGRS